MTARRTTGLLPLLFAAAASAPLRGQDSVEITNLQSGPICWDSDTPVVCYGATEVTISGQQECVFNGRWIRCTWYGYSFDYVASRDSVTLQCQWASTLVQDIGDPDSLLAEGVTSGEYELLLPERSGYFINPQYANLPSVSSAETTIERLSQSCSHDGVELLSVYFDLRRPARR